MTFQHVNKLVTTSNSGDVVIQPNSDIYVYKAGTSTLAQIYTNRVGSVLKNNPFNNGATAMASFYIKAGRYDIYGDFGEPDLTLLYEDLLVVDEDVLSGPNGQLMFQNVIALKAGQPLNRDTLDATEIGAFVGQTVKTVWNNDTSKKGGAEYVIWTLADYRTFIGDGAWVPDGDAGTFVGGDHYVGGGVNYVAILSVDPTQSTAEMFGVIKNTTPADTSTNAINTTAFQKYVNYYGGISVNNLAGLFAAKMAAGESVEITCYGDSTTDGNQTTGWSQNPVDGSGNAIGTTDHNLDAPNSWPVKLQTLLRDIYQNSNINVHNAGYSGRKISDGWALSNYDRAVVENPFYGVPDVVFVAFGLNDILDVSATYQQHLSQSRMLLRKIIAYGSIPILLTTDPSFRNGESGALRDHKEATRQIDSVKKVLASEFGIPLIDANSYMKDWIENNEDGLAWSEEQDDGLHFSDAGHAFKAQCVAINLFNDYAIFDGGSRYFNTWNSATDYTGNYNTRFKFSNNKQGGNISIASGAASQGDLMRMWVWNTNPNGYLVYLGLNNENYNTGEFTIAPSVKVKNYTTGVEASKNIISVGNSQPSTNYQRSDEPFIFGKLPFGLSLVCYVNGDSGKIYYGGWRIVESSKSLPTNALIESGAIYKTHGVSEGIIIKPNPEAKGLANVVGGYEGEKVTVVVDCELIEESGIIVLHGQGFNGISSGVTNNQRNGLLVFRSGNDSKLELYNFAHNDSPATTFNLLAQSAALPWATNGLGFRLELYKSGTSQQIDVYDAKSGGSLLLSATLATDQTCRWGGVVGGYYYNSDSGDAVGGDIVLNECLLIR